MSKTQPVLELRVALTTTQLAKLQGFYCDSLGLAPEERWTEGDGTGLMLNMGRGTLELFNEEYAALVDEVEVGRRVSGPIRFALRVPNLDVALERLSANGATLVHEPVITQWGDRNARLVDPTGMQLTLFEASSGASGRK